ncbi:MAG: hypothetical protein ACOCP8_05345 [archaeon]
MSKNIKVKSERWKYKPENNTDKLKSIILKKEDKEIEFQVSDVETSDVIGEKQSDLEKIYYFERKNKGDIIVGEVFKDGFYHWVRYNIEKDKWFKGAEKPKYNRRFDNTSKEKGKIVWDREKGKIKNGR